MKYLIVSLAFLAGCASPVILVQERYRPEKGGIVQIPQFRNQVFVEKYKKDSQNLMTSFCQPAPYEILEVNRTSTATGSTSSQWSGVTFNEQNSRQDTLINFRCLGSQAASLTNSSSEPLK